MGFQFDGPTIGAFAQAVAILVTGGLAVWAALRVGKMQAAIQAKQVEILEGQNKLKENEIKLGLLERRMEVIGELRDSRRYAANMISKDTKISNTFLEKMFAALNLAKIIFQVDHAIEIEEITKRAWNARYGNIDKSVDVKTLASVIDNEFPNLIETLIAHARVDL